MIINERLKFKENVAGMFGIDTKSIKYPSGSSVKEVCKIIDDYFIKNKSFLSGSSIKTSFGSVRIDITHTSKGSYPSISLSGSGNIIDPSDNSIISKDYPISETERVTIKDLNNYESVVRKQIQDLTKLLKKSAKENRVTDYRDL